MDIKPIVEKYKTEDTKGLWDKIGKIIEEKEGKWDTGLDDSTSELTQMLVYEYATSLEAITEGKLTAEFVIDKLSKLMGTFRLGDFKQGQDDNIKYDQESVTSEAYKKHARIDGNFGAHQVDYEEDGKKLFSVVMFDKTQQYQTSDGVMHTLKGGDLTNLDDIRQTLFHEWTHVMEKCFVKSSELTRDDIIKQNGDSTYINSSVSADWRMEEYKAYIANVDKMLETEDEILFNGISTIEINERKSPNRRIMHNKISEGGTELISQKIMEHLGRPYEKGRYENQAKFVGKVFESLGTPSAIATYLTSSRDIVSYIESKNHDGKDVLRSSDDFIEALGRFEGAVRNMIRQAGNNPGKEFEGLKKQIIEFWKQGKKTSQEDIENVFKQVQGVADIPQREEEYVKGMLGFALDYPNKEKRFQEEIDEYFPSRKKEFSKDVVETIEQSEQITQKGIDEETSEIARISRGEPQKIGEEQKQAIEVATRRCIARMGEGKVPEEQIQRLLLRMYDMKDVKEAMDSLIMNVNNIFGTPGAEELYNACLDDIMKIDPTVYSSREEMLSQLEKNIYTNYTPGNISIEENHALIESTLKTVCDRLNEQGVDYYIVGALSTFIGTNTPLFRYHGDIDFMISEADMPKVQAAMVGTDYEFSDDRLDNKRRLAKDGSHAQGEHEVIANHKDNEFHLGFFLFRREKDGAITGREYFMEENENGKKVPRILERYIPKELAELDYTSEEVEFAGTRFRVSTPESVISKKEFTRHPKDLLDIEKLKGKLDPEKVEERRKYCTTLKVVEPDEVSKNLPKEQREGQSLDD